MSYGARITGAVREAGTYVGRILAGAKLAEAIPEEPKDAGVMVEIVKAVSTGVWWPIQFFHLPVDVRRVRELGFNRRGWCYSAKPLLGGNGS